MFFKKKIYDDEYEKAKIRGLEKKVQSERLISKRKALETKASKLRSNNSNLAKFGKMVANQIAKPSVRKGNTQIAKPSVRRSNKPKKNPLDDFFR